MILRPNIGSGQRLAYLLVGAGLVAAALLAPLSSSKAIMVGALGALAILSGATGF